jgi:hypothetical protein
MKSVYNKLFCKYSRDKLFTFSAGYQFINKIYWSGTGIILMNTDINIILN